MDSNDNLDIQEASKKDTLTFLFLVKITRAHAPMFLFLVKITKAKRPPRGADVLIFERSYFRRLTVVFQDFAMQKTLLN